MHRAYIKHGVTKSSCAFDPIVLGWLFSLNPMVTNVSSDSVVIVIDDDGAVRVAIKELLESVGLKVVLFRSAAEVLESTFPDTTSCMVLDVRMPQMSGLTLQEKLSNFESQIPIVFITGHADTTDRPLLLARGAVACLLKPFSETTLLDALNAALLIK